MLLDQSIYAEAAEPKEEYLDYIDGVCETYDIDPYLVQAIIFVESSWCPSATNGLYTGLMQVSCKHKSRMEKLGVTDLTNAYQNILIGVDLLAELRDEHIDTLKVLDAYSGQLHSDEWYEQGNMTRYSKRVLKIAEELESK